MLTNGDLTKIRKLVRQEVHNEIEPRFISVEKNLRKVDKKVDRLQKDFNYLTDFLDREHLKLARRVTRIEEEMRIAAP